MTPARERRTPSSKHRTVARQATAEAAPYSLRGGRSNDVELFVRYRAAVAAARVTCHGAVPQHQVSLNSRQMVLCFAAGPRIPASAMRYRSFASTTTRSQLVALDGRT